MKKVLIYEGMNWHGECLSSYYYYFKELGYDVDFLISECRSNESPLWMLKGVNIYSFKNPISKDINKFNEHIKEIKSKVNLFNYDLYFICTLTEDSFKFMEYLYKQNHNYRNKILFQCHRSYKHYLKWTNQDKIFNLNGFTLGIPTKLSYFNQLSPIKKIDGFEHNIISNEFNKDKTLSIFIGGLSHIHFKNFEFFVKAVEELNSEGYNIKVNVTGIREQRNYILPKSNYINYLGRLNFKDMTEQYINNDFLFVLFDEKAFTCLSDHKGFLDGRVSGSRNMSIMYKIPLVVQKPFQLSWGLNDNNSISYIGHDYKQILLSLYNIKEEKYNNIIDSLKEKEQEEFNTCLYNLKNKINLVENLQTQVVNNKKINKTISKNKFIYF